MEDLIFVGMAFFLGGFLAWVSTRAEKRRLDEQVIYLKQLLQEEKKRAIALEEMLKGAKENFKGISLDALKESSDAFLKLAQLTFERFFEKNQSSWEKKSESDLKPIRDALERCHREIGELEKSRIGAYFALKEQVGSLIESQKALKNETHSLVRALKNPHMRGRWGELQLRRVVELAGMLAHCDFAEQQTDVMDGARVRPDLVVHLPGARNVVIDSKVPLNAFFEAEEAQGDEMRAQKLKDHARLVRMHIHSLSKKGYGEYFQSAEFAVLFMPGESLFSTALEQDPELIEVAAEANVILATPMTLIAILKAIAFSWKQEKLSKNAEEIATLGRELYKRLSDMTSHFARLGRGLEGAVEAYNKCAGSFESRVMVAARRFEDLKADSENRELEVLELIDKIPRRLANEEENAPHIK